MAFTRRTRQKIRRRLLVVAGLFLLWQWHQNFAPISFKFPVHGQSSWYSRYDPGINRRTANNEIFNDRALTCAMWGVPFHTQLRVTNKTNGKSVIVRVNDRGPHRRFVREGRVIDLTKAAFNAIASNRNGLIDVKVEKLEGRI